MDITQGLVSASNTPADKLDVRPTGTGKYWLKHKDTGVVYKDKEYDSMSAAYDAIAKHQKNNTMPQVTPKTEPKAAPITGKQSQAEQLKELEQ
jgi:hypothetical protein